MSAQLAIIRSWARPSVRSAAAPPRRAIEAWQRATAQGLDPCFANGIRAQACPSVSNRVLPTAFTPHRTARWLELGSISLRLAMSRSFVSVSHIGESSMRPSAPLRRSVTAQSVARAGQPEPIEGDHGVVSAGSLGACPVGWHAPELDPQVVPLQQIRPVHTVPEVLRCPPKRADPCKESVRPGIRLLAVLVHAGQIQGAHNCPAGLS